MKYILSFVVLVLVGFGLYSYMPATEETKKVSIEPFTELSLLPGDEISSPLVIEGKVPGTWYFEASFPVRILDGDQKEIAVVPAQAEGEWMTENPVPFKVMLTFAKPPTEIGTVVLEKDNPSGLAENAAEVRIPIRFK